MKMPEDLKKETFEIMRILSSYKTLKYNQILRIFPERPDIVRKIIMRLIKQKRVIYCENTETLTYGDEKSGEYNRSLITAFWVLLDFLEQAEYHSPADFPAQIVFFMQCNLYEIIYAEPDKEIIINHALSAKNREQSNKIIIVDDEKQIPKINAADIICFCIVNSDGGVNYYNFK